MRAQAFFRIAAVAALLFIGSEAVAGGPYQFYALTPCRVADTRSPNGLNGGPALTTAKRDFAIQGRCGVPTGAKAVALNVTIANASTSSWLTVWPANVAEPFVSTINFTPSDSALANGAIVGLGPSSPDLSIRNAIGSVHVIIDVSGYFQ
jgi:hypothetical protein